MKVYSIFILLLAIAFPGITFSQTSGIVINARVYLEGALTDNNNAVSNTGKPLMRDNLRLSPFGGKTYIPLLDPYKYEHPNLNITSKYTHIPSNQPQSMHEILDTAVLDITGQNAIVDWVFLELRSPTDSTNVVATRSCLVQRDGDIVDLDGVSLVNFPTVTGNQFFVAIRHRSHLAAMTLKTDITQLIDFTTQNVPMFDFGFISNNLNYSDLSQNEYVKFGYWALWGGDFNADGKIKSDGPNDDMSFLYSDVIFYPNNSTMRASYDNTLGYYNTDFNMNSKAKFDNPFDDKNMLYSQMLFYVNNGYFHSNYDFFVAQLPKQ